MREKKEREMERKRKHTPVTQGVGGYFGLKRSCGSSTIGSQIFDLGVTRASLLWKPLYRDGVHNFGRIFTRDVATPAAMASGPSVTRVYDPGRPSTYK